MKKILLLLLILLCTGTVTSQEINLNQYKHAIVNGKFDFVKQTDGYQTSSLTKFLFNKKGFVTFMDNEEVSEELAMNKCKAIFVDVKDDSGLLNTKLYIELRDCRGKLLYTSPQGSSRLKQYVKAYRQAIRQAFQPIQSMSYSYDESYAARMDKEQKPVKQEKVTKEEKIEEVKKEPIMVTQKVAVEKKTKEEPKNPVEVLYAQAKDGGYQLVNTEPKVIFILLKTSDPDKFIIKDKNGTLAKSGSIWIAEYYNNGKLVIEKYQVKF